MLKGQGEELHAGFNGHRWLVHKFGGTSVANADCFQTVATILEKQLGLDEDIARPALNLAVVVSAIGGKPKTTDLLLDAVKHASERNERKVEEQLATVLEKHDSCLEALFQDEPLEHERLRKIVEDDLKDVRDILKTVALMKWEAQRISELVSGYGELWSTQILTAYMTIREGQRAQKYKDLSTNSLHEGSYLEHKYIYLDARRVITVDEEAIADGAIVWETSQTNLQAVYDEEMARLRDLKQLTVLHFITTGYVASNTNGVATTLQRDGSDYSAAIMGRLLSANSISIWTDVDGVLSADPRRVPQAQILSDVSYNEAMELAYFGAKVIHPKTMQPAISSDPQIPIFIRNTFNSSFPGTRIYISSTTTTDREKVVCGFSSIESMALINVEGSGMIGVPGVAMRIFATLERAGISVVLISQASSEHSVTFATMEGQALAAKVAIEEEFARELRQRRISSVDVKAPCSIIAAVGDGMSSTTGVSGRFFSALGDSMINILAIAQGSSERNISAVVWSKDSTRALRAVHSAFHLSYSVVRVGIVGMSDVGKSLLRLIEGRRDKIRAVFDVDVQVCAILPEGSSDVLASLENDVDGGSGTITMKAYERALSNKRALRTKFSENDVVVAPGGLSSIVDRLFRSECTSHCVFDCTGDEAVSYQHAKWLRSGIDVITANNTGLSGPKKLRDDIKEAEKAMGKQSAQYMRQVTVAGGLPILSTLRNLMQSGDTILRIDGIFTVVLSYIMYRISPPPDVGECSKFDEKISNGVFKGDLSVPGLSSSMGEACSLSQAIKEAIALGLTEEDPTTDVNNEYTARVLMVLARELALDDLFETSTLVQSSESIIDSAEGLDFDNLPRDVDLRVQERVDAARAKKCVLRSISSIDVQEKHISIKIVEVPEHHVFALSPPNCACVRFFTKRHHSYPLTISGPSAGADSTASALLAELLQRTRGMSSVRSLAMTREGSAAYLRLTMSSAKLQSGTS